MFDGLPDGLKAALLATVIAFLRMMYDDREPRFWRRVLESALCGAIAVGVSSGVEAFGGQSSLSVFLGGMVGLFGADQVRAWGRRIAETRIGKNDDRDTTR